MLGVIRDYLIPALRAAFPSAGFTIHESENPFATLPSPCPAVGLLQIYDDGHEATVDITQFLHGHFEAHDPGLNLQERECQIAEDVVNFVRALLEDHVLLDRATNRGSAGWCRLDLMDEAPKRRSDRVYFVWSGPYVPDDRFRPTNK